MKVTARLIERLSTYRRNLQRQIPGAKTRIYSHELAALVGETPALVRRDLMTIGFTGSPAHGYDEPGRIAKIAELLDPPGGAGIALVGVGALGRAILRYFHRVHPEFRFVAAFDTSPDKVGQVFDGCPCHALDDMEATLRQKLIAFGVIAVPADAAQVVATRLVRNGVRALLNFTPERLQMPPGAYVEDVDLAASLEKVVFFGRLGATHAACPGADMAGPESCAANQDAYASDLPSANS